MQQRFLHIVLYCIMKDKIVLKQKIFSFKLLHLLRTSFVECCPPIKVLLVSPKGKDKHFQTCLLFHFFVAFSLMNFGYSPSFSCRGSLSLIRGEFCENYTNHERPHGRQPVNTITKGRRDTHLRPDFLFSKEITYNYQIQIQIQKKHKS